MKVLLSIKPEYVDRILNGSKKFEFRKVAFKNNQVQSVVIYLMDFKMHRGGKGANPREHR
ncbi:hypothetical protein CKY02_11450 [Photorhabdus bodei]|uniref:ASCH domain-containing protein n=1 Tax=Photorhabdus bodei TaxID=2029681 RepID=A0A329X7J2_9GAMM|nr:hypothetical protein CKY02_11450 [Photorhabdus bodei]